VDNAPPTDPFRLLISNTSGRVDVTAEARDDVVVERGVRVGDSEGGVLEIRPERGAQAIAVRCPTGTDVMIGTTSGAVELRGRLRAVSVTSSSGRVRVAVTQDTDLRTQSGRIEIDECTGHCRASTKSAAVIVGAVHAAEIATISGAVRIGRVTGTVDVRTVSGKVVLFSNGSGAIGASTLSGSITIHLPPEVHPDVRAADARWVHCTCEGGNDVTIDVASLSGKVEISPA
jgi:DUF4097 and DUF4098 domain-containing protein YvlB